MSYAADSLSLPMAHDYRRTADCEEATRILKVWSAKSSEYDHFEVSIYIYSDYCFGFPPFT